MKTRVIQDEPEEQAKTDGTDDVTSPNVGPDSGPREEPAGPAPWSIERSDQSNGGTR
jgi:hypothetical protein